MESFSIQCESCQARLKVPNANLIGKRLPCPGCSAPVLVQHPDETASATGLSENASLSESFDDIEQLLSTSQQKSLARKPGSSKQKPGSSKQKPGSKSVQPRASHPGTNAGRTGEHASKVSTNAEATDSLNPVDQQAWANPATQRKRKAVTIAAATLGGVVLLVAAIAAWLSRAKPVANDLAQRVAPTEVAPDAVEDATAVDAPSVASNATATDISDEQLTADVPGPEMASEPQLTDVPLVEDIPPPMITSNPPTSTSADPGTSDATDLKSAGLPGDRGAEGDANLERQPSMIQQLRPIDSFQSSLGELSSLLEQSGSSITEFEDATAALQQDAAVGLPRYYFRRSTRSSDSDPDMARQLALPCDGLLYKDTPLVSVMRDITVITGVPISFDLETIAAAGKETLLPTVNVNLSQTDFIGAIRQIVDPLGYEARTTAEGVVVALAGYDSVGEESFDLSPLQVLGDEGLNGFAQSVTTLFAAESWVRDPENASLRLTDTRLTVKHTRHIRNLIRQYVDKTVAAFAQSSKPVSLDAAEPASEMALKTRLQLARASLSKPCDLRPTVPGPVPDLLQRILEKTGVNVVINWETLGPAGWTPSTMVPGNISEPTVAEMVRQVAIAMDAAFVVIDGETIEITSSEDAANRPYVEYYAVGKLHEKNFSAERIMQLIQESAPLNLRRQNHLFIYEPGCQSIVVFGDRPTHRVVQSVLNRLQDL